MLLIMIPHDIYDISVLCANRTGNPEQKIIDLCRKKTEFKFNCPVDLSKCVFFVCRKLSRHNQLRASSVHMYLVHFSCATFFRGLGVVYEGRISKHVMRLGKILWFALVNWNFCPYKQLIIQIARARRFWSSPTPISPHRMLK